ncbi:MAG: transcriptional regulator GutM [Thermanaerothrix sp.]|uniref:transcriptional regulator GutM n=1 Tax=Thermanaerothrix sp. TaxID=2972675 RepID=UPI003C7AC70D
MMLSDVDKIASTLIIGLVISWSFQLVLTYFQMQKFYKRINTLKRMGGVVSIGMAGSRWKGRHYAVLVVDKDTGKILRAEKLNGWSVFASLKPIKELEGHNVRDLINNSEENIKFPMKGQLLLAFQNAANYILETGNDSDVVN